MSASLHFSKNDAQVVNPFPHKALAQILAAANYASPTVPPLAHVCRNCAGPLSPNQPCGAFCKNCALTFPEQDSEDLGTGGAITVALVAAAMIGLGFVIGRFL